MLNVQDHWLFPKFSCYATYWRANEILVSKDLLLFLPAAYMQEENLTLSVLMVDFFFYFSPLRCLIIISIVFCYFLGKTDFWYGFGKDYLMENCHK